MTGFDLQFLDLRDDLLKGTAMTRKGREKSLHDELVIWKQVHLQTQGAL